MSAENKVLSAAILGAAVLYVGLYWAIGSLLQDCSDEIDVDFSETKKRKGKL